MSAPKLIKQDQEFLQKLKKEAKAVSNLETQHLIPSELSGLANLVAQHTWQVLLFLAILASIFWEICIYKGTLNG